MAIIKCKMCGGDLNVVSSESVVECEYCGSRQTIPAMDDEKKLTLFARANRLRIGCEFDKAAGVYEAIVAEFPTEAEAYWGLVLCKYGIEYVDDPATGKKIPTCHRSSFSSIMEDNDFEQAQENADAIARRQYREEAKQIEELRKGIISVSANEQSYDIFICYKETDENGSRTLDSVLAQDTYDALTNKGYRVFFSRISLEDKLGTEFEPYIFAALNSAKIMLAFGTDYEYFNAVWVKNEWSRYLKLMAQDKEKHLIPCYKGIDAYDMPKEFARLQAQDMGKLGAIQDLLRGIEKLLPLKGETVREVVSYGENPSVAPLLKRAFMFLEDGDWQNADAYCEKVLDADPENGEAYLGKMMAKLKIQKREMLTQQEKPFDNEPLFQKAVRYGDEKLKSELQSIIHSIKARIAKAEEERRRVQEERRIAEEKLLVEARQLEERKREAEARIQAILERNCKKIQEFQFKWQEKRCEPERKRCEGIRAQNDIIRAQNDEINAENGRLDTRIADAEKRLAQQRQIYAANERKIFGAGARAKKEAQVEIPRLEYEINSLKRQKRPMLPLKALPNLSKETDERYSVGDYVKFGTYPQNRLGSDDTPIEWLVLTVEDNKALLLSRYGLDVQPYDFEFIDITWEKCTLRKWLNNNFINRAFSAEERSAIMTTDVDNSSIQCFDWSSKLKNAKATSGGNDTQDNVFLLSYTEANRYLYATYDGIENLKSRVVPTTYAITQGAYRADKHKTADGEATGGWWLRSPGNFQCFATFICSDGSISSFDVRNSDYCVRPAIWVNLES